MPSKEVARMLGEGKVRKPGELFQTMFPSKGRESAFEWRVHRVLGVAPTSLDPQLYEEFLDELAIDNVDSDHAVNEVTLEQLARLEPPDESFRPFFQEVLMKAKDVGANMVAFTTEL